jgi:hypothetical protein
MTNWIAVLTDELPLPKILELTCWQSRTGRGHSGRG